MNRKEEMEALAKYIEEGNYISPDDIGTRNIALIVAALRASAAPEEGRREAAAKIIDPVAMDWNIEGYLPSAQIKERREAALAKADVILAALPSDSGKAAPVGWFCPVDPDSATAFRWKRPEDGLCNSFGCKKQLVPVYAALAPATEEGMNHRTTAEPDQRSGHRSAEDAAPRKCTCHPDDNPPRPCAEKYALGECRTAALADAMWQLLDDMGKDGQCVCFAAKVEARIAFEPFRALEEPDYPDWMTYDEAIAIRAQYEDEKRGAASKVSDHQSDNSEPQEAVVPALSPSPSVGTPEMPSAHRNDGAE